MVDPVFCVPAASQSFFAHLKKRLSTPDSTASSAGCRGVGRTQPFLQVSEKRLARRGHAEYWVHHRAESCRSESRDLTRRRTIHTNPNRAPCPRGCHRVELHPFP